MSILDRVKARMQGGGAEGPPDGPVALTVDNQPQGFNGSAEFGLSLAPRTEVPAALLRVADKMSDEALRDDLNLTRAVHKKLTHMLLRARETGVPLAQLWREIDISKIYEENQWQALVYALSDPHAVPDAYRQVALVKYLQYLKNRRDVLSDLQRERSRVQAGGAVDAPQPSPATPSSDDMMSFTAMQRSNEYSRLPPRHSVELALTPGEAIVIFLAHRRLRLVLNPDGALLSDDRGLSVPLQEGRLVVGRSNDCDVVLRDAPADVSRKHLMIEAGHQEVRLTDLSSHGTFVPKSSLANTHTRH